MTDYSPHDLAQALGKGLLSFPVTHFAADFSFDEFTYRKNIERLTTFPITGLFAAGGTGEFFSLQADEVLQVVRAAVDSAPEGMPVLAAAGRSAREAGYLARGAEEAGADGILLMPPYLTESTQEGLYRYVKTVAEATDLGIIIYGRASAVYEAATVGRLAEEFPNVAGYKDGIGDIELMTRVHSRVGDSLLCIGGLPTAETFALPYLELGVTTYSSAIFNFVPQFATEFFEAVRVRDRDKIQLGLREFVLPYTAIRDHQRGYAVSIVKAGMKATGHSAGPVRPPLTDLTGDEQSQLAALIATVQSGFSSLQAA